jgi:two-component system, cell cycle response regulator
VPVIVLRSDDFATVDELLRAREAVAAPVLLRVRADQLEQVLARLPEGDDVCLLDDPTALVDHRLRALARRAGDIDGLTGLMTRNRFAQACTADAPAALLMIDLDHFKHFNDRFGHLAGDEVLKIAALRIRAASPGDALVARYGGEEFAIALAAPHDAHRVAAAIRAAFHAAPFPPEDVRVTVSIGMVARASHHSYQDLLRLADGALYAAKARGRDRIVDHAEREREARERDGDVELDGFEEMTRVLAERVADVISWRGRRVFEGLRAQADVDALTGLYSRRYLDRRLAFEIEQAHASGRALSLGLLDVDHFGQVNKQHGWPTGDRVLADAAARIRDALRESDWAARYGGEEICIILDGAPLAAATAALERVRTAIAAAPFVTTSDEALAITASIGCVELAPHETLAQLVERASAQLLAAKQAGRDRVIA